MSLTMPAECRRPATVRRALHLCVGRPADATAAACRPALHHAPADQAHAPATALNARTWLCHGPGASRRVELARHVEATLRLRRACPAAPPAPTS